MNPNSPLVSSDNFSIISIHTTLPAESESYQFVAITSNGCRLYLSHFKDGISAHSNNEPNGIELIHVRTPPPQPSSNPIPAPTPNPPASSSSSSLQQQPMVHPPQWSPISKCFYNNDVFMMVNTRGNMDMLTSTCPDIGYLARKVRKNVRENHPFLTFIMLVGQTGGIPWNVQLLATPGQDPCHCRNHKIAFSTQRTRLFSIPSLCTTLFDAYHHRPDATFETTPRGYATKHLVKLWIWHSTSTRWFPTILPVLWSHPSLFLVLCHHWAGRFNPF